MGLLDRIPTVFAHRGGWGPAAQNSLRNLDDAAKAGAHMEYDVRRTLDGVLVVFHDERIGSRKVLGREVGGIELSKTNYADLPLLSDGQRIPTAREVLELGKRNGRAQLVETKAFGYEQQFLDLARDVGVGADQLFMQSFIPDSVIALKQVRPDIAAGLLSGPGRGHHAGLAGIAKAKAIGADFVLPHTKFLNDAYYAAAADAGLPIVAWSPWKQADAANAAALLQHPQVTSLIVNQRDEAVAAARANGRLL